MRNKIFLVFSVLILFSSIAFATSWTYDSYDTYNDDYDSETSWVYPESDTSWVYPDYNYYEGYDDYYYNDYSYYNDYYYSDYYNEYPWYSDYMSYDYYDYYPSQYNYYSQYSTYPGFTYVSDLRYDHNVNYYIDPIVSSQIRIENCNDPSGRHGERTIMGINTKIEFECQNGVWRYIQTIEETQQPSQGAASKRDFYLDP